MPAVGSYVIVPGAFMVIFSFLETLGIRNARLRLLAALPVSAYLLYTFIVGALKIPRLRLIDLFIEYDAARVLAAHGRIYALQQLRAMADRIGGVRYGSAFSSLLSGYTHPPSGTFFDLRWTLWDWQQVKVAYAIITPMLFVASLCLIWLALKPMAPRVLHWIFPAALFVFFIPAADSMGLGQSDITIFFFMVVSFWAYRRGHTLGSGLALGVAILMKLSPAVFLLYWAWKREWRMLIYSLVSVAFIGLLTLPVVGLKLWMQFITQIFPALATGTAYAQNQSLPGLIARLMLDPRFAQGLQSAPSVPAVRLVTYLVSALVIGLALYFTRGRLVKPAALPFALEYSVWLIVTIVISPIAWDHYFTWMLLPFSVLLTVFLNSTFNLPRAIVSGCVYVVGLLLVNISPTLFFSFPQAWQKSPLLYGALLVLLICFERLEALRAAQSLRITSTAPGPAGSLASITIPPLNTGSREN